ncbi:18461_t:CDS:2 [Dentiscutata erythropus]|uniref:18461_t:CDS:1 n=1 Tax=Dentiscutata erythropus TaxID=1348616 RepID=A0A9N9NHL8_9GLOM|nr:18461_t:CDS:2 [Dentiscutata erythropus]
MAKIDDEIKEIKNSSVCEARYSVSNTTLTEMKNFIDTPAFDINSGASVKTHNTPISSHSVNTLGINAPNNASNSDITEKLDKNNSIDTEGEHQTDSYWVLGSHCPLCRENHMSLYKPGIPLDDVLKIQELKTQRFTSPIPWNNALILPDKSIVVEA